MKAMKKVIAIVLVLATMILGVSAAMAESNSYLYATTEVNLRQDAGTDQKVVKIIRKGEAVAKVGSKFDAQGNIWYQVKTNDGKIGYAASAYFTAKHAVVGTVKTTARLKVRQIASASAKQLGLLEKGQRVSYTATYKTAEGTTWYLITGGNVTGWVSGDYVTK